MSGDSAWTWRRRYANLPRLLCAGLAAVSPISITGKTASDRLSSARSGATGIGVGWKAISLVLTNFWPGARWSIPLLTSTSTWGLVRSTKPFAGLTIAMDARRHTKSFCASSTADGNHTLPNYGVSAMSNGDRGRLGIWMLTPTRQSYITG